MAIFDLTEAVPFNSENDEQRKRRIVVTAALELFRTDILAGSHRFPKKILDRKVNCEEKEKLEALQKEVDKTSNLKIINNVSSGENLEIINPIKNYADWIEKALEIKNA